MKRDQQEFEKKTHGSCGKRTKAIPRAAESASKGTVAATATAESANTASDAITTAANKGINEHYGAYHG